MKRKYLVIAGIIVFLLGGVFFVLKGSKGEEKEVVPKPTVSEGIKKLKEEDLSVEVEFLDDEKGKSVNLAISDFPKGVESFQYEITYEALDEKGKTLQQGVIGSPVLISELEDGYSKKIFLGSCSRNICVAHKGMKEIKLLIRLTYEDGEERIWEKKFAI